MQGTWGAIFLGVGVVMLVISIAIEAVGAHWRSTARPTEGTVVRLVGDEDGVAPVVRYRVDGRDREWQSALFSRPPAFAVGQSVRLLFQPGDPDDAAIDTFLSRHFGGLIAGSLGLVFTVVGAVVIRAGWMK
jgi:hypothetical protein